MPDFYNDTIGAISTALSPSGIAIVRVSGKEAFSLIEKVFDNGFGKKLTEQKTHTIHHGYIMDGNETVDEVLVMLMRGPHSYTGEDTVEIDCHGGVLSARSILDTVVRNGVRPAEPGEFTKRAFLNGRMDLSQAEAVMDIISARNQFALKSSIRHLRGAISDEIRDIRQKLIHETAFIEAALDDPEHYDITGYGGNLKVIVEEQRKRIRKLIDSSDSGRFISEGIKTVIVGKPNAGKSSLLNALAGEEKAIVTDIEGTTRDVLEDQININGITLCLMDTAGIRQSDNIIEQIGVEKAIEHASHADLILYVVDSSASLDENDLNIIEMIRDKKSIVLLNKSDLDTVISAEEMAGKTQSPCIYISAKNNEGIDVLEQNIKEMFFNGEINFNDEIYITNMRHKKALSDADENLGFVIRSIEDDMPEDFYSIDLMAACDALGVITGQTVGEDLVNEIFSSFCMGK